MKLQNKETCILKVSVVLLKLTELTVTLVTGSCLKSEHDVFQVVLVPEPDPSTALSQHRT